MRVVLYRGASLFLTRRAVAWLEDPNAGAAAKERERVSERDSLFEYEDESHEGLALPCIAYHTQPFT